MMRSQEEIGRSDTFDQGIEVERIEGKLLYLKGHKYPLKGIPMQEHVDKANEIKSAIKKPWILESVYPNPFVQGVFSEELRQLIIRLTNRYRLADQLAFVVEHDQAYRLRLQDLFSETEQRAMRRRPIREILRLMRLHKQRDIRRQVHPKLRALFIGVMVWIVFNRRKWEEAINQADFTALSMDESDRYWACHKHDYDYMGIGFSGRQVLLKSMV